MAASGNATKHGFLVREGDALERLAKVSEITFDKMGTLTYGTPEETETLLFQPEESDMREKALSETEKYINACSTVIYVLIDEKLVGYIVLSDTVREESGKTVESL